VFIDDFSPDTQEVTVGKSGATVKFGADNWAILYIDGSYTYDCHILDSKGDTIVKNLPLGSDDLATISIHDDFHDFNIEKKDKRTLEFSMNENMDDSALEYEVVVGNRYEEKSINVTFPPSAKYVIDSLVYKYDKAAVYSDNVNLVRSMKVNNESSSKPAVITLYPYEASYRKVSFSSDDGWTQIHYQKIFGRNLPDVMIPEVVDGGLQDTGTKCCFGVESAELDSGLDPVTAVQVSINAGEYKRVDVYNCVDIYTVPFTAYVSNPDSGKKRVFSGILYSEKPFDYIILKRNVEE
jgi:hypothetical protein